MVSVTDDEGRVSEAFFVVRSNEVLDVRYWCYPHLPGRLTITGEDSAFIWAAPIRLCAGPYQRAFSRKEDPMSHRIAQYMYWDEPMQEKIQAQKYSACVWQLAGLIRRYYSCDGQRSRA